MYARLALVRGLTEPRVHGIPGEKSFRQFVHRWRTLKCDVMPHPAGDAANMPFKSTATLLAARYVGAVPLVDDEPTWAGLGPSQGVSVAGPSPDAWAEQLRELSDPAVRRDLFARLDAWCRAEFDPAAAVDRVRALDAWAVPATPSEREDRLRRARAMPAFSDLCKAAPDQQNSLATERVVTLSIGQSVRRALARSARRLRDRIGRLIPGGR